MPPKGRPKKQEAQTKSHVEAKKPTPTKAKASKPHHKKEEVKVTNKVEPAHEKPKVEEESKHHPDPFITAIQGYIQASKYPLKPIVVEFLKSNDVVSKSIEVPLKLTI